MIGSPPARPDIQKNQIDDIGRNARANPVF